LRRAIPTSFALAAATKAPGRPTMFAVTQVRQALQQTVAIGAFSPSLAAT
jgi:hypothetical protein